MKTRTEKILVFLHVIAWLAFVGYCIICGALVTSFVVSYFNPEWAGRVYQVDPKIYGLLRQGDWYFYSAMSIVISVAALKAFVWYIVIKLLMQLNINAPFSSEVAGKLENISYQLFRIWILALVGQFYFDWLAKRFAVSLDAVYVGGEFLVFAALVYIISQIFKRGIELQEENQLTV